MGEVIHHGRFTYKDANYLDNCTCDYCKAYRELEEPTEGDTMAATELGRLHIAIDAALAFLPIHGEDKDEFIAHLHSTAMAHIRGQYQMWNANRPAKKAA